MSISETKARHLRFLKNKQMASAKEVLRRDDDEKKDKDSKKEETDDEGSSKKTKTKTKTKTTITPTSTGALIATSAAATTSGTAGIITGSPAASLGGTTGIPASVGKTTGAPAERKSSPMPTSTIILVAVFAVLGFALILGAAIWLGKRRKAKMDSKDTKKPSSSARSPDHESRLWGGATTDGAMTEVNFRVSQIPPSMQPGGRDYNPNNFPHPVASGALFSQNVHPGPQQFITQQPVPPQQAHLNGDNASPRDPFNDRESITGQSPEPLRKDLHAGIKSPEHLGIDLPAEGRASVATTVPHFRNVNSWARDQRSRTGKEDDDMPVRPHNIV
ncbi:hypothetical protein VTL71DRAFT_13047 [Oculimacula yallundae]|uniref:Uncharacterized protein n=1 Tax=Oculimacula yallundae TaxID=86028 RepID=A0ABR4CP83_9HELO